MDAKEYLKAFKSNYKGESEEAKEVKGYLKSTYNDANYIPWATMERLALMQDPLMSIEVVPDSTGNLLRSERVEMCTKSDTTHAEAVKFNHYVAVKATFMGRELVEYYPIQDKKYQATQVIDQNLFNKAVQRGKAKVLSRVTGLALSLYETGDLQFGDDEQQEDEVKTEVKKEVVPAPVAKVEVPTETIEEYAKEINDNFDKYKNAIATMNKSLKDKGKKELLAKDSVQDLTAKLNDVSDPHKVMAYIRLQSK